MELIKVALSKLKPYQNNPRYNDESVEAVEESIEQVGYITPVVVDEGYQILAGETRWRALNNLGENEIEVIRVTGLTEAQKRKFRLLDNKTAEIANWDLKKLLKELEGLDFGEYDFWSKELEKMSDIMLADSEKSKKTQKPIICPRCGKIINNPVKKIESFVDENADW